MHKLADFVDLWLQNFYSHLVNGHSVWLVVGLDLLMRAHV